jgi:predicted AAA+ superfamily ATPase
LIPPFFENLGKRLIKAPKMYIADSGMACHLLRIQTETELAKSPFLGMIFEGFIAAEIAKSQVHAGMRQEIYYFRDQQGLEVDFIVPAPRGGGMHLIECKASKTPTPSMAAPMMKLAPALLEKRPKGYILESFLIHRGTKHDTPAISPGVKAIHWMNYFE